MVLAIVPPKKIASIVRRNGLFCLAIIGVGSVVTELAMYEDYRQIWWYRAVEILVLCMLGFVHKFPRSVDDTND
jgi:hypothetical protein